MMQGEKREDRQSCSDLFRLIRAGASAGHCERGSSACGGSLPTSPIWHGREPTGFRHNPQFFNQLPTFGLSTRCGFLPLNADFLPFIDL